MKQNEQAVQFATVHHALRGDEAAISFVNMLAHAVQVWDDLIDADREVPSRDINRAFETLLIDLPANPFYMQHLAQLHPVVAMAVNAWHDSNLLARRGGASDVARAYVLRDTIDEVVIACARIIGGWDWMRQVSMLIRDNITHEDTIEEFQREVGGSDD